MGHLLLSHLILYSRNILHKQCIHSFHDIILLYSFFITLIKKEKKEFILKLGFSLNSIHTSMDVQVLIIQKIFAWNISLFSKAFSDVIYVGFVEEGCLVVHYLIFREDPKKKNVMFVILLHRYIRGNLNNAVLCREIIFFCEGVGGVFVYVFFRLPVE